MSTLSQPAKASTGDRTANRGTAETSGERTRRLIALVVTVGVLLWSVSVLTTLVSEHTIGPEVYGVIVAAITVVTGVLSAALLAYPRARGWMTAAVLVLWAVIALGGLAGSVAHIVGPVPGHGPVDARPRPVAAPLIFTAFGLIGGVALFFGRRVRLPRLPGG